MRTNIDAWRFGAFELSESLYDAGTVLPLHSHDRAYLGFVVNGRHRETTARQDRDCGRSSVVFHPAAERHANRFSRDGGRIFRVEIDDRWLTRLRECDAVLDEPVESHGGGLSRLASRILSEFRARDAVSPLMIEGLVLEFMTAVARGSDDWRRALAPVWLRTAVDYLHAQAEGEIRLDAVAAAAGVHPAHLNRVFRTHYRCSVGVYVRRLRVERASRELVQSQRSITDIATTLGFADQSHFTRVFLRVTGLTPGRYRRLHGEHAIRVVQAEDRGKL
ncbi:MAG: helix-turn-helix transcriptional regulator [Thermoanaerobaculia bacterium]